MTLVPSLLQAIVLMDGEALVLHVGDKPYVVAESGQVTLANTPLTATSIGEVIHELLPPESGACSRRSEQRSACCPKIPFSRGTFQCRRRARRQQSVARNSSVARTARRICDQADRSHDAA